MSRDRLKDHFSAYYEGSLDPAMQQSLRARFEADPELKKEYDQFAKTMRMLGSLSEEIIESPMNLSDKIASRLEQQPAQPVGFALTGWFRSLGFAALAAVAIGSAVLAIKQISPQGNVAQAGAIAPAGVQDSDALKLVVKNGVVTAQYKSSVPKTVLITNAKDKRVLKKFDVGQSDLSCELDNPNQTTEVFQIDITGEKIPSLVFVPSKSRATDPIEKKDQTLVSFVSKVCDSYGVTVQVAVADAEKTYAWPVTGDSAFDVLQNSLGKEGYSITQMNDGMLVIRDK